MSFVAKYLALASVSIALAGAPALAQTVAIDYDHSVNFLKFKTYTWAKIHATDAGIENRIDLAVNRDLGGRYMTEVSRNGDVTIAAVECTQDQQEYTAFYNSLGDYTWQRGWGSAGFLDSQVTLQEIPVGTLIIDMYDTKTHKLLWRGTVTEPVAGREGNKNSTIDKAVTLLIDKYPPKFKK